MPKKQFPDTISASSQDDQDLAIAANTALLQDAVNATQVELDAALAAGATDTELEAIRADLQTKLDALQAAENAEAIAQAAKDADQDAIKADKTALDTEIASTDAEQATQDAAILLRELLSNKQTVVRAAGAADDTAYPSEKAVRDAIDALNFGGVYQGSDATVASLPAGVNGDWAILNTVDGINPIGIYVTDGTNYSLAKELPDFALLTQAQVTSTSGAPYTEAGIISAERLDQWEDNRNLRRVYNFGSYGEANAAGVQPRDTICIIGMEKEVFARTETTGSFPFPGTGAPDANWFRVGDSAPDPQSLILDNIEVTLRSAGTNAGSNVALTFVDKDGNSYPASDWLYSADLTQYSGGAATIVTDKATFNGLIGLGRNKVGTVKFYYNGDLPNGLSAINAAPANGGSAQGVIVTYEGTNYNDSATTLAGLASPLYWTTSKKLSASDQAAPLVDATEYLAGSVFSAPEPDNTDLDYGTWFNWRVNDGETIADTDVPNGTEAEILAIKPKLTRFGVGTVTDEVVIRFPGSNGAQLNDFENTYWSDETVGAMPTPVLGKEFATGVSSAASTDTEAVKDAATVTLTHYRWVDNGGAALVAIPTESPTSGPEFDLTGIVNNDAVKWDAANSKFIPDNTALTGNAVERDVIQANRGSIMSFGDLQFRVPSSGNSSLQMRTPGGSVSISEFTTKWSNQQGGASENPFGFTLNTSWRYFRSNGALNLTLHNSYQDATFLCNGWLYRVEVIVGSGWTSNRFSFSRWRQAAVKGNDGNDGNDGVDAASIDHISLTSGDSSPGTTDTYTLWGDAGETVNLGTYDVPIPSTPAGIASVELASYSGAYTTGRTFTLAGGRTWQDVLDEFQFVYVLVGGNSLYSSDQVRQFHVDDLTQQGRDMACTGYMTHGSNAYHFRLVTPSTAATTLAINNDNSSMQVQRIVVRGIK